MDEQRAKRDSEFSDYLIKELSVAEHDYTEVLYRMRYIDEQLISSGKGDTIKNMKLALNKPISLTRQEEAFLYNLCGSDYTLLKNSLALCKNPMEIFREIFFNINKIFLYATKGIYITFKGAEYIFLDSIWDFRYYKETTYNLEYLYVDFNKFKLPVFDYNSDRHVREYSNIKRMLMEKFTFKNGNPGDVDYIEYVDYLTFYISIDEKDEVNQHNVIWDYIFEKYSTKYRPENLIMELYLKVLNKRIRIENLQKMYERKTELFYSD